MPATYTGVSRNGPQVLGASKAWSQFLAGPSQELCAMLAPGGLSQAHRERDLDRSIDRPTGICSRMAQPQGCHPVCAGVSPVGLGVYLHPRASYESLDSRLKLKGEVRTAFWRSHLIRVLVFLMGCAASHVRAFIIDVARTWVADIP